MDWIRVTEACAVAIVAANLSDWFFFGILFQEKYGEFPEVWRLKVGDKAGERKVLLRTALVCALTPLLFVLGCACFNVITFRQLSIAVPGIWAMMVVPHVVSNYLFMKLHPLIAVSHALGWLARLVVSGLSVAILM
jgi:hypothetical protein